MVPGALKLLYYSQNIYLYDVFFFPVTVKNINDMEPQISSSYHTVKMRQEDLERRRRDADEKLQKLKDLVEQVLVQSLVLLPTPT